MSYNVTPLGCLGVPTGAHRERATYSARQSISSFADMYCDTRRLSPQRDGGDSVASFFLSWPLRWTVGMAAAVSPSLTNERVLVTFSL